MLESRNCKQLLKARTAVASIFHFVFFQSCFLTLSPHISLYVCLSLSSPECFFVQDVIWISVCRFLAACRGLTTFTLSGTQETVWTPCRLCLPAPPYIKFQMFWRCPPYIGVVQDGRYMTPWGLIQAWCMQNLKFTKQIVQYNSFIDTNLIHNFSI